MQSQGFTKLVSFVTLDAPRLTATSEESYICKVLFLLKVAKKSTTTTDLGTRW